MLGCHGLFVIEFCLGVPHSFRIMIILSPLSIENRMLEDWINPLKKVSIKDLV